MKTERESWQESGVSQRGSVQGRGRKKRDEVEEGEEGQQPWKMG